jgi:1,4-alpha-glucan branching enzyme
MQPIFLRSVLVEMPIETSSLARLGCALFLFGGLGCGGGGASDADAGADALCSKPLASAPVGATLSVDGAIFRVWAPGADRVSVVGDWSAAPAPLARECATDYFSARVSGPRALQTYVYTLQKAGAISQLPDPRARRLAGARSVLIDGGAYAWQSPPFQPPSLRDAIIYELHVGSFDPSGTFAGVAAHLDYLAGLGINVIELLPIGQFKRAEDWGYGPQAPWAIEAAYGSPDDLRALVDAAHARGIAVLVDTVHNHYAGDSYLPAFYFYPSQQGTPWGPRPDYSQSAVRAYIKDQVLAAQAEYRLDGFRWDAVANIRLWDGKSQTNPDGERLLTETNAALHRQPTLQIAEDFAAGGDGLGFDARWDARFFSAVDTAVAAATDADRDLASVAAALSGPAARVQYTESHDEVGHPQNGKRRIPTRVSPTDPEGLLARKLSTLGAVLALTAPGAPMIFMGQEMLETRDFAFPAPPALDWTRTQRFSGIVQLYRDLIHLRSALPSLRSDAAVVYHRNDKAKVLAVQRGDAVVIANLSAHPFATYQIGVPLAGQWSVKFSSDWTTYSTDFGGGPTGDLQAQAGTRDGQPAVLSLPLPAYSAVVLAQ